MAGQAKPFVSPAAQLPATKIAAGTATEMQVLVGPEQGAPNFMLRRFIMGKGGWQLRRPAPLLGQHTEEVLSEAGAGRALIGAVLAGAPVR